MLSYFSWIYRWVRERRVGELSSQHDNPAANLLSKMPVAVEVTLHRPPQKAQSSSPGLRWWMMPIQGWALAWFPAGSRVLVPSPPGPTCWSQRETPSLLLHWPSEPLLLHSFVAMPQSSPSHRGHGLLKCKARKMSSFLCFSLKRERKKNDRAWG